MVTGVLMALYEREQTGKGQVIEFSLTAILTEIKRIADLTQMEIPREFHRFEL